jgi:hypothetical protein
MAGLEIKSKVPEGIYVVDVEGAAPAMVSTLSSLLSLFRYVQATQTALASLGIPPVFEPLQAFELHIQEEYGGFRRDQMKRIQNFQREKDDTPCIIYMKLARFDREPGNIKR